jgi:hypothetical protein
MPTNNFTQNYLPMMEDLFLNFNNNFSNFSNYNIDTAAALLQQHRFGQKIPSYNFSEVSRNIVN